MTGEWTATDEALAHLHATAGADGLRILGNPEVIRALRHAYLSGLADGAVAALGGAPADHAARVLRLLRCAAKSDAGRDRTARVIADSLAHVAGGGS